MERQENKENLRSDRMSKSCKDCLHNGVCYMQETCNDIEQQLKDFGCENFTARSEWVHLPCKVGDMVYYLRRNPKTFEWHIQETKVYSIDMRCNGSYIYVNYGLSCYAPKEIGKRLFLTREEAEKALEKKK